MSLTEKLNGMNKRIGALESKGLDENAGVAKITKIYGNVKITATITASLHQYPVCSETTICSESLII